MVKLVAVSPLTSASGRAMPKSANMIRRLPSSGSASKMFAGLTSRCSSPRLCAVRAVDVVHRDPEVTIELAAIVHRHDVRVPQRAGQVGFALKPLTEVA